MPLIISRDSHTGQILARPDTLINSSCNFCQKPIQRWKSHIESDTIYCNTKCYHLSQRKSLSVMCAWCAQAFSIVPSMRAQRRGRYCSTQCGDAARRDENTVDCPNCGRPVQQRPSQRSRNHQSFCSVHCKIDFVRVQAHFSFWRNYDMSGGPDACWPWLGYRNKHNYGALTKRKKQVLAHRESFIRTYGPLPKGFGALHSCDNPPCGNPIHLFPGTDTDNMDDRNSKGRTHSHLTEVQAREILSKKGVVTGSALSKKYGVSAIAIYNIWSGVSWKRIH